MSSDYLPENQSNLGHSCLYTMEEDEPANEGNVCDALFHIFGAWLVGGSEEAAGQKLKRTKQ